MDTTIFNLIKNFLHSYKKKTIDLVDLQKIVPGDTSYDSFFKAIIQLEKEGGLVRIKSSKDNGKVMALGNRYKISNLQLNQEEHLLLHKKQLELDNRISLEKYYQLSNKEFLRDLPVIEKINDFLINNELPTVPVSLPKLSHLLVRDEKWLQEKGGISLLKRIKLWTSLQTVVYYEPLAFAINPKLINRHEQYHLIVENKTPFIELLEVLKDSGFSSLIYGCGWQIVSSINQFKNQIGTTCNDTFYYFGDLDYEGIHIWHSLNEQIKCQLAKPFYMKLLSHSPSKGKTTQKMHKESLEAFLKEFDDESQKKIIKLLDEHGYYPQEVLSSEELEKLIVEMPLIIED